MTGPLRLIHPDVITPVSTTNVADGVEADTHVNMVSATPVRRTRRFYNFREAASPESPCIPIINLNSALDADTLTDTDIDGDDDNTDAETSAAFISNHIERSQEREFGRLLRQYQEREIRPHPQQPQHNNKENIPPAEPQPKYLGLKQIAYMNVQEAIALSKKYHNIIASNVVLELYTTAWLIDPCLETLGEIGVMLENDGFYADAVKWYMRALDNGCVTSIYNLADLYDNMHPELGLPDMQVARALHYYRLGAALQDHGCLVKVMSRYYQMTNAHSLTTNEGVDARIMLNKYYTSMIRLEEPCQCHNESCACPYTFDRYDPKGIGYDDVDREIFDECLADYTLLGAIKQGEELLSILEEKNDDRLAETMTDISYLKKGNKYISYRNKIALFTKLNHVIECAICYETKVNIDLNCAHTFCEDCYVRVYESACPMCRCQSH